MAKPSLRRPDPHAARRFDAAYYRRHYRGPGRVHSASQIAALASGVAGLAAWLGLELRTVLDVGAGPALWRAWFRRHRPAVRYRSVDVSPYACERWGHELRDVARWRARTRFDLVVCHGVLHYLDERRAARAIENLGAMAGGLLYLEALAAEDLAVVDRAATDLSMPLRPAAWYRRRLTRRFVQVGAGLWAARRAGLALYALEAPPPPPRLRASPRGAPVV